VPIWTGFALTLFEESRLARAIVPTKAPIDTIDCLEIEPFSSIKKAENFFFIVGSIMFLFFTDSMANAI
jgi:hypothetical protein